MRLLARGAHGPVDRVEEARCLVAEVRIILVFMIYAVIPVIPLHYVNSVFLLQVGLPSILLQGAAAVPYRMWHYTAG